MLLSCLALVGASRLRNAHDASQPLDTPARPVVTKLSHSDFFTRSARHPPSAIPRSVGAPPAAEGEAAFGTEISVRQMAALTAHQMAPRRPTRSADGLAVALGSPAKAGRPSEVLQLLSDSFGTEYVGPIGIGTRRGPAGEPVAESELRVVFDTGSADLWVASDLCVTGPCSWKSRRRFNHSRSETFHAPEGTVRMTTYYGSGQIEGFLGADDVHLGPFVVRQQTLGLIAEERGRIFGILPADGLLGLGFEPLAASEAPPLFDSLTHQHVLPTAQFAFYLNPDYTFGGALLWGGIDERLYEKPLIWFPVTEEGYWSLELLAFHFGNRTFQAEPSASPSASLHASLRAGSGGGSSRDQPPTIFKPELIVDSGTTFITAAGEVYEAIRSVATAMQCSEAASLPPLVYTLRDSRGQAQNITVPPEEYMVKVGEVRGVCKPGIMDLGQQFAEAFNGRLPVILGEVFMRHHFTVFRRSAASGGRAEVGIARPVFGAGAQAFFKENGF